MRKGILISAFLVGLLAAPATASAVELGNWRVTATASITYEWTYSGSDFCQEVGPGRVSATVTGRSKRFRMGYFARGGYKHWAIYPGVFKPTSGTITMTDGTHQNPPEFPSSPCTPTDKSGCVSRPVDRNRTYIDVSGKNARRNVGAVFDVNGLRSTFERLPRQCEAGGFSDFSSYVGTPRNEDYGQLLVPMPAASRIGRRPFTVTKTETSSGRGTGYTGRAVRRVTLRFTPA